jgi:hypothetical protein
LNCKLIGDRRCPPGRRLSILKVDDALTGMHRDCPTARSWATGPSMIPLDGPSLLSSEASTIGAAPNSGGEAPAAAPAGGAPPTLSLPRGGGVLRGIGQEFSTNPVPGTGSLTVPIATSPGRAGFGPQLSLTYDFAHIEHWTGTAAADVHWRSITRDNATMLYGGSPATGSPTPPTTPGSFD